MHTPALTAFEHAPIPVAAAPTREALGTFEVERLHAINERLGGFCVRGHHRVKLSQFCGVVNLGGRMLEILPKIEREADANRSRGLLLRMLRVAHDLPIDVSEDVLQEQLRSPLLEVFVRAFLMEVATIVRAGLHRAYVTESGNLAMVRGRIVISRQLVVNAGRPDRMWCEHDELVADNLPNRIVLTALRAVRGLILSADLARSWFELHAVFGDVACGSARIEDIHRLRLDRRTRRYRAALQWAAWILQLLSPSQRAGRAEAPALLFDMNKLFERYVERILRRASPAGVVVRGQAERAHLAWASEDDGSRSPAYRLRPDLTIREGEHVIVVADTKWKLLVPDEYGRVQPTSADVYQLNAYAAAHPDCAEFALIYPAHVDMSDALLRRSQFVLRPAGLGRRLYVLAIDLGKSRATRKYGSAGPMLSRLMARESS